MESLLEGEGFYELLCREGSRLYPDEWFADCYDESTGRPSVPPGRMMKLLLLQTYEGLSDREARERMAFDLRWKAVLGMGVDEGPVAQSTLVYFRARLQLHDKLKAAFERFLERAVEVGLLDPEEVQVVDSTAVWGRGAVEDTYNLIGSAVRKLLGVTADRRGVSEEAVAAGVGLELVAPSEEGSLKGRAEIDWSEDEERRAFLNEVVGEARALLRETAEEQAADPEVREAAQLLARLLRQDLEPVEDDEGPADDGPEGPERSQGSGPSSPEAGDAEAGEGRPASDALPALPDDPVLEAGRAVEIRRGVARERVVSVHDPEMRHGHKSRDRRWDGYKAHVSVSAESEFVTAVAVTPANQKDARTAPALMDQQEEAGLAPDVQVGDMAYSAAELRETVRKRGTEIVARVPSRPAPGGRFPKEDFELDLEAGTARCPAGEVTERRHHHQDGGGQFLFDGETCAACPLREQCTGKDPERMRETGNGRTITIHPREQVLQEARAREETDRFQQLIGLRPVVERKIAHLRRFGLRQARYLGAAKTEFQARATALVANLARMAALLPDESEPRTRWAAAA